MDGKNRFGYIKPKGEEKFFKTKRSFFSKYSHFLKRIIPFSFIVGMGTEALLQYTGSYKIITQQRQGDFKQYSYYRKTALLRKLELDYQEEKKRERLDQLLEVDSKKKI